MVHFTFGIFTDLFSPNYKVKIYTQSAVSQTTVEIRQMQTRDNKCQTCFDCSALLNFQMAHSARIFTNQLFDIDMYTYESNIETNTKYAHN